MDSINRLKTSSIKQCTKESNITSNSNYAFEPHELSYDSHVSSSFMKRPMNRLKTLS